MLRSISTRTSSTVRRPIRLGGKYLTHLPLHQKMYTTGSKITSPAVEQPPQVKQYSENLEERLERLEAMVQRNDDNAQKEYKRQREFETTAKKWNGFYLGIVIGVFGVFGPFSISKDYGTGK